MFDENIDRDPDTMRDCADKIKKAADVIMDELARMHRVMVETTGVMDAKMQELAEKFESIKQDYQDQIDEYLELARKLKVNADEIETLQKETHF